MKSGPLEASEATRVVVVTQGVKIGVSIIDLVLRIFGIIGTLGSAVAMGTTSETLPFVTQFVVFKAQYNDLPTLTFFVVVNAIVCAYLAFSLLPSIFHIIRNGSSTTRIILIMLDTAMLALLMAGASAASAIVYLAHEGNSDANWSAICQQFDSFCERMSGSLIGSFGTVVVLILLILLSAVSMSRH